MRIRLEDDADCSAIYHIHASAFATSAEAELVNRLREQASPLFSLVADRDGIAVGHLLFSPVTLGDPSTVLGMGLAPLAVLPEFQGQGIGSMLVREGLEYCKTMAIAAVVVLGNPAYYGRFGFVASSSFGLTCVYDVPAEMFMAMELKPQALANQTGLIEYHQAFNAL